MEPGKIVLIEKYIKPNIDSEGEITPKKIYIQGTIIESDYNGALILYCNPENGVFCRKLFHKQQIHIL
jgi:hypothetical protein